MDDVIRNNQSNECLQVTQNSRASSGKKLYNGAKFVGVVVGDVEEKFKSKKNVTSFSFILYFYNSISISDSQF